MNRLALIGVALSLARIPATFAQGIAPSSHLLSVAPEETTRVVDVVCDPNWGANLGSYRNVTAYSNGPDPGCVCCPGTYGFQYQCVEYTERFFSEAMHFSSASWTGDGNEYYASAETKGLRQFAQNGTVKPKENDILCFSGGFAGHVGIITQVIDQDENGTPEYLVMIDQNRSSSSATINLTIQVTNGHYHVNGFGAYAVQGWLRGYTSDFSDQVPNSVVTLNPGQPQHFRVRFKNTSRPNAPHWKNDGGVHSVELRSCNSRGAETSCFLHPVPRQPPWLDPIQRKRIVRMTETNVGTDGLATFEFWGMVPEGAAPGTYYVYFRPYHESGHWIEEWDGMNFTVLVLNSPNDNPNLSFEYDLDQNQQADNWNSLVQGGGVVATYESGSAPALGGCNPYEGGGSRIARLNNNITGELSILHHDISGPWGALMVADTWYRIGFWYRTDTPFHVRLFQPDVTSPSLDIGADVAAPTVDGGWHRFTSAPFRPTAGQLNMYRKFGFRLNADHVGTLRIDEVEIVNSGECYP